MNNVVPFKPRSSLDPFGDFLDEKRTCETAGISRSSLYALMKRDRNPFPQPVNIFDGGKGNRWVEMDVLMWKAREIAYRTKRPIEEVLHRYEVFAAAIRGEHVAQELVDS